MRLLNEGKLLVCTRGIVCLLCFSILASLRCSKRTRTPPKCHQWSPQWQQHPGPKPTLIQKPVEGSYIIPPHITLLFYCPACNTLSSHVPYKSPLALTKLNNLAPLHILFSFPYFLHLMIRKRLQAHCCQRCRDEKRLSLSSQGFFCCFVLFHIFCPDFDLLRYE